MWLDCSGNARSGTLLWLCVNCLYSFAKRLATHRYYINSVYHNMVVLTIILCGFCNINIYDLVYQHTGIIIVLSDFVGLSLSLLATNQFMWCFLIANVPKHTISIINYSCIFLSLTYETISPSSPLRF